MKKITHIILLILLSGSIKSQTPNLEWASAFGNSNYDDANTITKDAIGNTYTAGRFNGIVDFDAGVSTYTMSSQLSDAFILKTDALGNFIWAKKISGPSGEEIKSIAVDNLGDIIVAGVFSGNVDFDPGPTTSYNLASAGGANDIFITKLNSAGDFVWAKKIGSTNTDNVVDLKVDAMGNVFSTGSYIGSVDFDPGVGTFSLTTIGTNANCYVLKLDGNGNFLWANHITQVSSQTIEIDTAGNCFIFGSFSGTKNFNPNGTTTNLTANSSSDIFITKQNANGIFQWAKSISAGFGNSVLDSQNNIYLTGGFTGTVDFDPSALTQTITSNGSASNTNSFIVKLDNNANLVWAKTIGGSGFGGQGLISGTKIELDGNNNIYTTGIFRSEIDFDSGPTTFTLNSSSNFTSDNYITKHDNNGDLLYAMSFVVNGIFDFTSLTIDNSNAIFLCGKINGIHDVNPSPTIVNNLNGTNDFFILKLNQSISTKVNNQNTNLIGFCSPNPANEYIQMTGINFNEGVQVKIISIDGKLMKDEIVNQSVIPVSELTPGMYFIELTNKEGKTGVSKFIKE